MTWQSGSFVWHDRAERIGAARQRHDKFALGYANSHTASLGESFTHTPSCAPGTGAAAVPSCTSDYVPKPQAALSFAVNRLIFNGSSAAKAFQSTTSANDKVARDASGQPILVQKHTLSYGFVYGNTVLWKQLSGLDDCAQKTRTNPSSEAST